MSDLQVPFSADGSIQYYKNVGQPDLQFLNNLTFSAQIYLGKVNRGTKDWYLSVMVMTSTQRYLSQILLTDLYRFIYNCNIMRGVLVGLFTFKLTADGNYVLDIVEGSLQTPSSLTYSDYAEFYTLLYGGTLAEYLRRISIKDPNSIRGYRQILEDISQDLLLKKLPASIKKIVIDQVKLKHNIP